MTEHTPHSVQDDLAIVRAALPRMEGYTLPVVDGVPDPSADPTPFWRLANPEVDAALKRIEEQLEATRHALEACGDVLFGTWGDDEERRKASREAEALTRAVLFPASSPKEG